MAMVILIGLSRVYGMRMKYRKEHGESQAIDFTKVMDRAVLKM